MLLKLAEMGAYRRIAKISTEYLARKLGISQQTASRYLIELERKGWIQRNITPEGSLIKIEEQGTRELQKLYSNLKFLIEKSYPPSVTLEGTVFTGLGEGAYYISKEYYRKQFAENMAKQSKLTDAYLDNLLGEDVYRGKMDELRVQEDECKKLVAGIELMQSGHERSQGYLNRVRESLDGYDEGITKVDFALRKQMVGLLFQNIKIAPPVGAARPKKRLSFTLFEPFQQLFSETNTEQKCQTIQNKLQIQKCGSSSSLSGDPWLILYRLLKPFLLTIFFNET